jgi:hypothetical protein
VSDLDAGAAAGAFTKKIGPLPGWAWVLIIVGLAYGAFLWRKRGAASGTVAPVQAPSAVGFSSAGPAPGTNTYNGQVSTLPVGQPGLSTNAAWAKSVTDFLVGTGNYSPADISNAIGNFISGNALNEQQTAIVNTAIKQFQTPPEGVLPVQGPKKYTGFMRDDLTGAIFGILPDGVRQWLTGEQYANLGSPATTSTVAQSYTGYARDSGDGKIYGLLGTGQRIWLDATQYAALGSPAVTENFTGNNVSAHPVSTAGHSYTLVTGDTPGSVATKFYGSSDSTALMAANPGALFNPGAVITVP